MLLADPVRTKANAMTDFALVRDALVNAKNYVTQDTGMQEQLDAAIRELDEELDDFPACEKCGGGDIHLRWHSQGGPFRPGGCGYGGLIVEYGEHMHWTCRRCQYEWTTLPLISGAGRT